MNRRGWFGALAAVVVMPCKKVGAIGRIELKGPYTISFHGTRDMHPVRIGETVHRRVWLTHRNEKNAPHTNTDHLEGFASSGRKQMVTTLKALPCGTCWEHTAEWITDE